MEKSVKCPTCEEVLLLLDEHNNTMKSIAGILNKFASDLVEFSGITPEFFNELKSGK